MLCLLVLLVFVLEFSFSSWFYEVSCFGTEVLMQSVSRIYVSIGQLASSMHVQRLEGGS